MLCEVSMYLGSLSFTFSAVGIDGLSEPNSGLVVIRAVPLAVLKA